MRRFIEWLASVRAEVREGWYYHCLGDGIDDHGEPCKRTWKPLLLLEFVWSTGRHWFNRLRCHVAGGHDWEDHSYGGPESGCIDLTCKRCGEGYHYTLY